MAGNSAFISYQRADTACARLLAERLTEYGVRTWWDAAIAPGDDWRERIAAGLEEADLFVVLHSDAAEQSPEVRKEIGAASALGKPIVAVRLENRQPKGVFLYEMAALNWVNAYDDRDAALDDLARRLSAANPRSSTRSFAAAIDARPIRGAMLPRLLGSNLVLLGVWAGALVAGFVAMNAMGEGFSSMATEKGATLTDLVYALGAVALGAPLLLFRFALSPPASAAEAVLLVAALVILACYVFMVRNLARHLRRRIARARVSTGAREAAQ